MKHLRITTLALAALFAFSCSSDDDNNDNPPADQLLNTPVAGTIYGDAFVISADGGYASNILSNEVEKVNIYLTAESIGCDAPDGSEFPVSILAPRAIGTHTANVSASFNDMNSTDYVSTSNITVEIISVGETVVGRVMGSSLSEGNTINGKFEVPYCN